MTDNDYNAVTPVEGLQNIAPLTGTKRREQRKPRQGVPQARKNAVAGPENLQGEHEQQRQSEDQKDHSIKLNDDKAGRCHKGHGSAGTQDEQYSIDYCA